MTTPPVTGEIAARLKQIAAEERSKITAARNTVSFMLQNDDATLESMRRAYALDRASGDGVRGVAYYVSAKGLGRTICGWVPVCGFSEPPGVLGLAEPMLWCALPAPPASDKE